MVGTERRSCDHGLVRHRIGLQRVIHASVPFGSRTRPGAERNTRMNKPLEADPVSHQTVVAAPPLRPYHPPRTLRLGDEPIEIDQKLVTLIRRLWYAGIRTCSSCQENEPGIVWIQ